MVFLDSFLWSCCELASQLLCRFIGDLPAPMSSRGEKDKRQLPEFVKISGKMGWLFGMTFGRCCMMLLLFCSTWMRPFHRLITMVAKALD